MSIQLNSKQESIFKSANQSTVDKKKKEGNVKIDKQTNELDAFLAMLADKKQAVSYLWREVETEHMRLCHGDGSRCEDGCSRSFARDKREE
jgi:hypothetical protein